jgi:hypothetical protein
MAFHFLSVPNNQPPFAFAGQNTRKNASQFTPLHTPKLTVNQPPHGFEGSSPSSPTSLRLLRKLRLGKPHRSEGCRAEAPQGEVGPLKTSSKAARTGRPLPTPYRSPAGRQR